MNSLYNLRDWFYECDLLLFLAEVHYHKDEVIPSEHRFSYEITRTRLEEMLCNVRELNRNRDYHITFESEIPEDDIIFLEHVLDNISSCKWDNMDLKSVLKAQAVVRRLTTAVNADILENSQLRSYPNIYNACQIK